MEPSRKCTECFYCRRGCVITYQPSYTCLHPKVRAMDKAFGLPEQCTIVRAEGSACGPRGELWHPASASGPQPIHIFYQ